MLVDEFIKYIRAEKRYSEHTARNYERDVRRFHAYLSSIADGNAIDPALITSDDMRGWIVSLSEGGLSPSSVNRMVCSVRAYFRYLRKCGIVTKDPFVRIGFQKTPTRLPAYIPESKVDDIIGVYDADAEGLSYGERYERKRNQLIILLFYSTGIRLAELDNIKVGDFSEGFRELRILGKGNKERIVPLLDYTREKLVGFINEFNSEKICFDNGNSLFLTVKGKPVSRSEIYRIVRNGLGMAGIQGKRSPHVLRHTFATHLLNDGADIKEIQELLGHSSLSATQVYTHNSITKLKEVYGNAHPRAAKKNEK